MPRPPDTRKDLSSILHTWGEAQISDTSVLVPENRAHKALGGVRPLAPESPGEDTWTFGTVGPGRKTVSLEYGQPWECGARIAWSLDLIVDSD